MSMSGVAAALIGAAPEAIAIIMATRMPHSKVIFHHHCTADISQGGPTPALAPGECDLGCTGL